MSQKQIDRILTAVLLMGWSVVSVFAIVFQVERLFADSSYYFFHTINQGYPQIDHQRFVLAFAEALPLIGSYIGLPINYLVLLYSLGHVIFSYLIFHHVYFKDKSTSHGILILLLQFTAYAHLFYSPMLELWYGLILLAWLDQRLATGKTFGLKNKLILFLLSVSILFSHPENFLVFLMVIGYRWKQEQLTTKLIGTGVLLMMVISVFKFATFSHYELGKVNNAQNNSFQGISAVLETKYLQTLAETLTLNYYDCLFYLTFSIIALLAFRKRFEAFYLLVFTAGFIAFINITLHRNGFGRYSESCYLPFVFMCLYAISLIWNLLESKHKLILGGIIIVFSTIRLNEVYAMGKLLQKRTAQMESFIVEARANHNHKMILATDNITTDFTKIGWSYPIEALVISSMDGPDSSVSIIFDEDMDYGENLTLSRPGNFILRRWHILEQKELEQRYFRLPETDYSASDKKSH